MLFILGGTEFSICFMKNVIAVCVFFRSKNSVWARAQRWITGQEQERLS